MNILIIGGTSSIAKYLIPILSKKHKVITAGRNHCDIYLDINEKFYIPNNIDIIINTTAYFKSESDEDYYNSIKTNVDGVLKLCIEANKKNIKHLIHLSSIFSDLQQCSPFYNMYAITKKFADEIMINYCDKNNLDYTILKPSQLYAQNIQTKHQPFFYLMINKAENGEDIYIYGKNDPLRNFLHFEDLANIIDKVVDNHILGVYDCQFPANVKYSEIAKTAQKIFKNGGNVKFLTEKKDIPDNIFEFNDDLYKKINYYPKFDINAGIMTFLKNRERNKL